MHDAAMESGQYLAVGVACVVTSR